MVDEKPQSLAASSALSWFMRLGISGKLLLAGGLCGLVAAFCPLFSFSVETNTFPGLAQVLAAGAPTANVNDTLTVNVIDDWRGKSCLIIYFVALSFAVFLYLPKGIVAKGVYWVVPALGIAALALAVWQLLEVFDGSRAAPMGLITIVTKPEIGALLNIAAGAGVAVAGFLKVREEKLI